MLIRMLLFFLLPPNTQVWNMINDSSESSNWYPGKIIPAPPPNTNHLFYICAIFRGKIHYNCLTWIVGRFQETYSLKNLTLEIYGIVLRIEEWRLRGAFLDWKYINSTLSIWRIGIYFFWLSCTFQDIIYLWTVCCVFWMLFCYNTIYQSHWKKKSKMHM